MLFDFKTGTLSTPPPFRWSDINQLMAAKIKNRPVGSGASPQISATCAPGKASGTGKNQTACADQLSIKAIRLEESSTKPAAVNARKPSERRSRWRMVHLPFSTDARPNLLKLSESLHLNGGDA